MDCLILMLPHTGSPPQDLLVKPHLHHSDINSDLCLFT